MTAPITPSTGAATLITTTAAPLTWFDTLQQVGSMTITAMSTAAGAASTAYLAVHGVKDETATALGVIAAGYVLNAMGYLLSFTLGKLHRIQLKNETTVAGKPVDVVAAAPALSGKASLDDVVAAINNLARDDEPAPSPTPAALPAPVAAAAPVVVKPTSFSLNASAQQAVAALVIAELKPHVTAAVAESVNASLAKVTA